MNFNRQKNLLLCLVIVNIFVSLAHYVHNIIFLPDYHEPDWITPALIDTLWFIMTPLGCAGYWIFLQKKAKLSYALLYIYCGLSLLVLGHYLITPIWMLSLTINVVIFSEAIAALALGVYVFWLQNQLANQQVNLLRSDDSSLP